MADEYRIILMHDKNDQIDWLKLSRPKNMVIITIIFKINTRIKIPKKINK